MSDFVEHLYGKPTEPVKQPEQPPKQPEPPYGEWCRDPKLCAGKGYCPRDPTCGD